MSPGRRQAEQKSMWLIYDQLPQSQGHVFYERLQKLLHEEAFDAFLEKLCALPATPKDLAAGPSRRAAIFACF